MRSDERRLEVLSAIVQDYVETNEPVGSKALVERHALGVSPATIRNDMAALEDEGLIHQPHTSAGRVPTDLGYRMFVDRIESLKPLSAAERRAIHQVLEDAVDLDSVVERTVRLLAQLTRQVAVVQYPSLRRTVLRHIEILPLTSRRVLVVIITEAGGVEQRTIELAPEAADIDPIVLDRLRGRLNEICSGHVLSEIRAQLGALAEEFAPEHRPLVAAVTAELTDSLRLEAEERIVLAGAANFTRSSNDVVALGSVLEALEEQVTLLQLLSEMRADEDGMAVAIGAENKRAGFERVSLVASVYGGPTPEDGVARLGVIGPTRMDYPAMMAAVRAVARYVSRFLGG